MRAPLGSGPRRYDPVRLADRLGEHFSIEEGRIEEKANACIERAGMFVHRDGRRRGPAGLLAQGQCLRYSHKYELVRRSIFVPKKRERTAVPAWNCFDWAADVLSGGRSPRAPDATVVHNG